jgi:phosphoribosylformylglycinamidine synthase
LTSVAQSQSPPLHRALGLTDWELDRIRTLLEREPNGFELAVFSLLWSEHCGYKHSALLLRRFPTEGPGVLQGPGENAGVVDVGDGIAVAFKVESHNHPSAVEPFQGAATGVGGILRDIVAMGARPIALLDSLRFGAPADGRSAWMLNKAVAGVGHYGNCLAGPERLLIRNSGTARVMTIGDLVESRGPQQSAGSWTAPPSQPFQVLSYDPVEGRPEWRDVERIFKRSADVLIGIRTSHGRSLTVTEDHPVIVEEAGKLVERTARDLHIGEMLPLLCSLPDGGGPDFLDLIDLADDAVVILPASWQPTTEFRLGLRQHIGRADARHYWTSRRELPVAVFKEMEQLSKTPRKHLRLRLPGPRSTPVPARLEIDRDFARLVGYYLAEGCCSPNGTTFKIIWTFGKSERDARSVADLKTILGRHGIRHSTEVRRSSVAITVSSRLLAHLLEDVLECGSRAHEKQIPSVLFDASDELRFEVLKGLFRGDGSITYRRSGSRVRLSHSTTSPRLHEQVILILQSIGIIPTRYERKARRSVIEGRTVSNRHAYLLEFTGCEPVTLGAHLFDRIDAGMILEAIAPSRGSPFAHVKSVRRGSITPVRVVGIDRIEGPVAVYDLEVPGTHLFATTSGLITHNCVGVPTVGGETVLDERYADNCLVNAMCVGLLPADRVTRARMTGTGHDVVLYGATTGRDGIGGASVLASQELSQEDDDKRPSVQIGDPFSGKKLIEASLELVEGGFVTSLQDCGAAGLASALAEMASKGEAGVDVHLDGVPLREEAMEPWEIMISESQERMVCTTGRLEDVEAVCRKWELECAVIGEVTESGRLRAFHEGELVGDIPVRFLTEECPRYRVEARPRLLEAPVVPVSRPAAPAELLSLLGSPALGSRACVYRQYDQLVGSRTIRRPGLDATVLRLRPSWRGIAVSLDGAGRIGSLEPRAGGALAVLEAARNVACAAGRPLAVTDCLNFGNPEKPEIAWELAEAIEGMALACEALGVPVVSGNVSLYNETDGRAIHPTPVVGCVGLVEDVRRVPARWREGDVVLLAGAPDLRLDGSEYQALLLDGPAGRPPMPDLAAEAALIRFLAEAAPQASCVHDAAEGGLAVCIAECAIAAGVGAELDLSWDARALFGEGGGQAVLAVTEDAADRLLTTAAPVRRIGAVGGGSVLGVPVEQLQAAHEAGLSEAFA